MNYQPELLNQLIKNRRSVFPNQYTGGKIDDSVVQQMLENANWAPNHGKTEPWRFFVFSGKGLQTFANFQAELYENKTKAEDRYDEKKHQKLKVQPLKASHIIAIVMQRQQLEKIPVLEEIEAVACAVQNMYLTATAYGVGAYWSSGGVTYWEETKEYFGLGADDYLLGFFYIGEIAIPAKEGIRKPIAEKTTWITE